MKKGFTRVAVAAILATVLSLVSTFALPVMPAQADSGPQCWAVIAGVSNYLYINDIDYSDDSAWELSSILGPIWGSNHIRLLVESQATKANILNAIDWLAYNADENDTALFYFSGHGSDYLNGFFFPYDTLVDSFENAISTVELARAFQPVQAGKIAIILDTCHAGCFQYYLSASGRVILMGTRSYEVGWETDYLRHGVFSFFLFQALNNFDIADINGDYELSAEELFWYAGPRTSEYEEDNYFESIQHPVLDDQYYGDLALLAKFIFSLNISLPYGETVLTLDGYNYTSAPSPMLWIPGVSHTITVPQLVDMGKGTRYVFIQWDDGSVTVTRIVTKGSYTANYNKEQLLQIFSDFDDPQGGGWYKDQTYASFSVTPFIELTDTRHIFTGWSGDYTGTEPTAKLYMDTPKTVTANWRHEYLLTLNSEYGTLTGAGWYREGETAGFSVTPYIQLPDTKHIFTGWSVDYSGTSSSASLVMDSPKTVAASWRNEYLLTLNSEYGEPAGAGWYEEGATASISIAPIQGLLIRRIFNGWSGDLTDTAADSSVVMDSPMIVTANWRTDYVQLYVLIGGVVVLAVAIITTVAIVRRHRQVI